MPDDTQTTSNRLSVDQPQRGADRNRTLAEQANPATDELLFPSLEEGITLLDVEGGRGVRVLQSLVLDHLLLHEGSAFWVDANGHATTTTLARMAPSQRLLDRIHVARGFTAYQHYSIVCALPQAVTQATRDSLREGGTGDRHHQESSNDPTSHTPSLVVAPAVDAQYRGDDSLCRSHAETLQARTLARLATYAERYDVPVVLTRCEADEISAPVARAADHRLTCEQTSMGPRFVGDDFETLLYPVAGGAYYQTTFAYWRELLDARARHVGVDRAPTSPSEPTPDGVGSGVPTTGETVSTSPRPLLDAWTAGDVGGQ